MKIRRLSIVLVMLFFVSTSLPMSYAEAGVSESTSDGSIGVSAWNNIITEELAVRLEKATDDEKITVTVRIKDSVDFTQVDILARERAGVTEAQLENDVAQAQTQTEIEGKGENQKEIRAVYSKIKKERTKILSEYYQELNAKFLAEEGLDGAKCASVSRLLPWISGIELTKAQIYRLATGGRVTYIDVYDDNIGEDLATISDTRSIIGGQEAITVGYTGSGVRVGLVESGNPILADMGADSANITKTVPGTDTVHATMTSGIIKKMAPGCSIYSRPTSSVANVVDCCEELIEYHSVDVINISYGAAEGGVYNSVSRQMDELVQIHKVAIVVAAGNSGPSGYVNQLCIGANVIAVGAVTTTGTSPSTAGALVFASYSSYKEKIETINKPDICAPGKVQIYSYAEATGTSLAAPHVTGTIVQMLSANWTLHNRPETIKAALMQSAFYNAGTDMTYVPGTRASNKEGAGVINAEYCFNTARNSNFTRYGMSGPGTYPVTVYCNSTSCPFRVAVSWYVTSYSSSNTTTRIGIDIYLYKNGQLVASSTANASVSNLYPSTNYEIIEIDPDTIRTYGTGEYQVRISLTGSSFSGLSPNYVGVVYGSRT